MFPIRWAMVKSNSYADRRSDVTLVPETADFAIPGGWLKDPALWVITPYSNATKARQIKNAGITRFTPTAILLSQRSRAVNAYGVVEVD